MKKIMIITLISIGPIITIHGVSVQPIQVEQPTMLMGYARMGNLDMVRDILSKSPQSINVIRNGTTALIEAAGQGHTDIVEVLLQHGADVHLEGTHETPLEAAQRGGNNNVIKLIADASHQ